MNSLRRWALQALLLYGSGLCMTPAWAEDPVTALGAALTRSAPLTTSPTPHPASRYQLALVIDDLGYNHSRDYQAIALPAALTVAVLPQSPWATDVARQAHSAGQEVILHQPMQTISGLHQSAAGDLWHGMTSTEVETTLMLNLQAVPGSVGVNNHRGSLLTAEPGAMNQFMQQLQRRGLYFLDSRTTAATIAHETARQSGVPTLKRDVFLDHVQTPEAIHTAFQKALTVARKQGYAVLIAHPHALSLNYLATALAALPDEFETVRLSELLSRVR